MEDRAVALGGQSTPKRSKSLPSGRGGILSSAG